LRTLKQTRTYEELSSLTGLPAGDLNRYVNGHVLPGAERARTVVGDVGEGMVQRGELRTGVNVPARAVGLAQAAFEDAREFAGEREQFGGPLTDKQGLRWQLAEMAERTDTSRLLVRRAASLADAGEETARATSMAKIHATEAAVANANDAMQVHGGAGYVADTDVGRYLRDARLLTVAGGPNEVHRDSLADALL
jgi:alkylation response protein AidB-like acyl-CoA dehydrogenase